MKITDLFIRRPVLGLVVNLVILIAGVQAYRTLNVRQYPRNDNATVTVTTVYVGASADLVRGFITTPLERSIAARGRDRLSLVHERAGHLHHLGPPQAQLRPHQGAVGDKLQGRPGAQQPSRRGAGAGDQHPVRRLAVRVGLPELHVGDAPPERDHRLPGARRPAAALVDPRRAEGGHPGRAHVRHAHLAQARPHGGLQHKPLTGERGPRREQPSERPRQHQGEPDPGRPDGQHGPALGRGVQEPGHPPAEQRDRAPARRGRRRARRRGLRGRHAVLRRDRRGHGDLRPAERELAGCHSRGAHRDGFDPEGPSRRDAGESRL